MAYLPEISKRRSMEMLNLMENRLNVLKASGRRASAKANEETPLERKSALRIQQLELRCLTVVDLVYMYQNSVLMEKLNFMFCKPADITHYVTLILVLKSYLGCSSSHQNF